MLPDYEKNIELFSEGKRIRFQLTEPILFLMIIIIESSLFFVLIYKRLLVGGHDGFEYFQLQYVFLNNVVHTGEIPQWMPFVTHGTVVNWWHIMQGGFLHNVLLLSGGLLKNVNSLTVFYAGLFLDELLLLCGVWLLGRRYYTSPWAVFFVALSIIGSSVWILQPWWNFRLYYAIPLILYFIHCFLDTSRWRYLFLAGNLLLIQSLGGLPYFLPVITLIIFIYFLSFCLINFQDFREKIKTIRFNFSFFLTISILLFSFAALYFFMAHGTDQLVNQTFRKQDRTVPLDAFLTYGGKLSWQAWLEMLLGVSPCLDYTLYAGILCLPFIVIGLLGSRNKNRIYLFFTAIMLILFCSGTFVSTFFYYCWPMMKFFRHLILVCPVIKVFLCFLAGFGFESLFFDPAKKKRSSSARALSVGSSIFLLLIAVALWILGHQHNTCYRFFGYLLENLSRSLTLYITVLVNKDLLSILLTRTAIFAMISALLIFGASLRFPKKKLILVGILLVILHGADIYSFKWSELRLKSFALDDELYDITAFHPVTFPKRRSLVLDNNKRIQLLQKLPIHYGVTYWTINAFLFEDQLDCSFKTDFWLRPFDNYMKAYWGQPINEDSTEPMGFYHRSEEVDFPRLVFPRTHPAALKISGAAEDKIQFFSLAECIDSDDIIASKITHPDYAGDIVFLSPLKKHDNNRLASTDFSRKALSANERLHLPYQVQLFDSNNIVITTSTDLTETTWLMYSDVWHPLWRATVNGKETPVYKANLAYKAVKLEKGHNKVHFYFKSGFMTLFHYVFGLNSLFWLGIIFFLTGRIAFGRNYFGQQYDKSDPAVQA